MPLLTKSGDLQVTLMHAVLHNTTVYTTDHSTDNNVACNDNNLVEKN